MARRRMFSLDVIDTDLFLDMSAGSQNLYFHLALRADDDGFIAAPKKIMKITNSAEDDLKILYLKGFVIPFKSGICVIKHWKIHNLIRSDRYTETIYKKEKSELIQVDKTYESTGHINNVIPDDVKRLTQVRLGKGSIGKISKEYNNIIDTWNRCNNTKTHKPEIVEKHLQKKHRDIIDLYTEEEVLKAICNYSDVIGSDKYWFDYSWSLWDFIARGLDNFIDDAKPKINYIDKKKHDTITNEVNTTKNYVVEVE